ncbi:hypothetical protein RJ640_019095 [Escallonia rubra]|uniref:Protein kish n=1 Tax=Escallonia rubra TaxID=112253 RepID=A0AA88R3S8_9ASTE|nr:hypothetical protein RJ640_019095 [Escallonia rubra]
MVNGFSAHNLRYGFDFQIALWGVLVEQSALFNFHSFLTVVLLVICTCTFLKMQFPAILEQKTGFRGFFWKAARIGSSDLGIISLVTLLNFSDI